jgi:hypothetical protein
MRALAVIATMLKDRAYEVGGVVHRTVGGIVQTTAMSFDSKVRETTMQ